MGRAGRLRRVLGAAAVSPRPAVRRLWAVAVLRSRRGWEATQESREPPRPSPSRPTALSRGRGRGADADADEAGDADAAPAERRDGGRAPSWRDVRGEAAAEEW